MFDQSSEGFGAAEVAGLIGTLRRLDPDVDDAVRIDRIRLLEELKSAVAAAQAVETAAFAVSQRAAQIARGVPAERVGRGVAGQVGLARRISPFHASRYVGWAAILTSELPHTFAALQNGQVSEWRAMIVARETAWLSREHRARVDADLAPRLEQLGDRRVEAEAKRIAYRLDPAGAVARIRAAENERRVGLRPAPDTMARLTGLLPVAQGVATYAALRREADTRIAEGDARTRGQIMADTLVQRITGQAAASDVPVEINLVMTDHALFGSDAPDHDEPAHPHQQSDREASADSDLLADRDEPAHLDGYGPIPAALARDIVLGASDRTPMWLRRLFTKPATGDLVAMETRRRHFTPGQRRFVRLRDQYCRTNWCEAPIRHTDHITPAEHGGPTSLTNARGNCEACNYTKQDPGWTTTVVHSDTGGHEVETTTPTGHRYRSRAPDQPGTTRTPVPKQHSPVEQRAREVLRAANRQAA